MYEKLEESEKLKKYMSSVPNGELIGLIDKITATCRVRRSTYFNWRSGRTAIPAECKKKIEKLAGQKIWSE